MDERVIFEKMLELGIDEFFFLYVLEWFLFEFLNCSILRFLKLLLLIKGFNFEWK